MNDSSSGFHGECLGVIGLGLIGGSFAKATSSRGLFDRIVAFDRDQTQVDLAITQGVVDEAFDDLGQLTEQCDLIFIAVPVGVYPEIFASIIDHLKPDAIVTDAGSTKLRITQIAQVHLGGKYRQFIPAHPIAGAERSGFKHASENLFSNRPFLITPYEDTGPTALKRLSSLFSQLDANVKIMNAQTHDEVFACVSHLPHLLTASYMSQIPGQEAGQQMLEMAGSGFKDFTRIAASSPELWRDVFRSNKPELLKQLALFKAQLQKAEQMIEDDNWSELLDWYRGASDLRANWELKN